MILAFGESIYHLEQSDHHVQNYMCKQVSELCKAIASSIRKKHRYLNVVRLAATMLLHINEPMLIYNYVHNYRVKNLIIF
jgi:predicted transcriptional regulator